MFQVKMSLLRFLSTAMPFILRLFQVVSLADTDIPNVFGCLLLCPLSYQVLLSLHRICKEILLRDLGVS